MTTDETVIIHPSSIVEQGAIIHSNVKIGPFCYIGADVEIGEGTVLKSHVVINGKTKIGKNNTVYQFSSIGEVNQDLKYANEPTLTEIGDSNIIHECVTIHRATVQGGGLTKIGSHNLFMASSHVAHDCFVGDHCILANNATLAGHVTLGDYVILGGLSAIHQFCSIGSSVMIGGCSAVVKDVPPYLIIQGNHAKPHGINKEGLKRRGFSQEAIKVIMDCYKLIYRNGLVFEEAKAKIEEIAEHHKEALLFIEFFKKSTRGIIR